MNMNMVNTGRNAAAALLAGCLTLGTAGLAAAEDTKPAADDKNDDKNMAEQSKSAYTKPAAEKAAAGKSDKDPTVVLVPIVFAADTNLADGCWARLYDSENFKGGMLTLIGPVDVPNTRPVPLTGFEFGTNYDSVAVGPKATLKLWDGMNYRNQAATIASGQKVADMDTRLGHLEDIESLKVSCSK